MNAKGFKGNLSGVPIAIEFHGDGSVTLCKEIVDEINTDDGVPGWLRVLLRANDKPIFSLGSKPVPQMPKDFTGFADGEGNVLGEHGETK